LKTLYLLRHAKSTHSSGRENDFERALTKGGRRVAHTVGAWMRDHDRVPALAIYSTAHRAAETWRLVSSALGAEIAGIAEEKLYLAAPESVFEMVIAVPDHHASVLIVGHNPGLHQLALVMAGAGAPDDVARLDQDYPPGALTEIRFDIDSWSDLRPESGRLERLVFPRDLGDGG
jgi:phosphohistidine phosphatase